MIIALAVVLLVIGSVLFHFLSPWYFTPIASNWGMIDDTVSLTFWVTGAVFVAVNLFMAYAVVRYRYNKARRAAYEPENKKLEGWLTGLTAIGVAAMLAPGLFVWGKYVEPPEGIATVEAVGQQWYWTYRFPGKDRTLGAVDAKFVTDTNPFGINPDDPNGKDDVLIPNQELHLPLNKPVKLLLRSKDVLHNFTVPQIRAKMDLVPGVVTFFWFTPIRTGRFDVLCEELCGIAHFAMRGKVVVDEDAGFQSWLAAQPTFAQTMKPVAVNLAVGQQLYSGTCRACHGPQGEGNPNLHAPKLAGQGDWYLKRQLQNFKLGARGTHENDAYGKTMAPMAATLANDAAIDNVVGYIKTLPAPPAATTVAGDAGSGERRFQTCAACHGDGGEGVQALNAPSLTGMSDWYLVTQLKNFRQGVRGTHARDSFGPQMVSMAAILTNDRAIADVVAYINTLAAKANNNNSMQKVSALNP
ncbi:MAG: c-type cytochrome [Gammaproteobacteria bacterium]|nr:c-type cytochrome [Gammaproteobacteria bacterium]